MITSHESHQRVIRITKLLAKDELKENLVAIEWFYDKLYEVLSSKRGFSDARDLLRLLRKEIEQVNSNLYQEIRNIDAPESNQSKLLHAQYAVSAESIRKAIKEDEDLDDYSIYLKHFKKA
jgi:hypothetical protein